MVSLILFIVLVFTCLYVVHDMGVREGRRQMYWEIKKEKLRGAAGPGSNINKV